MRHARALKRTRWAIGIFVVGMVLSGATAFPLSWEMDTLCHWLGIPADATAGSLHGADAWFARVRDALHDTDAKYPFIAYGTDWLAFAHLVIAIAFVGPWRDPVRNRWVIEWGLICCLGVIPLAMICGPLRGIPFGWRLIDCSFGVLGAIPLLLSLRWIRLMETDPDQSGNDSTAAIARRT